MDAVKVEFSSILGVVVAGHYCRACGRWVRTAHARGGGTAGASACAGGSLRARCCARCDIITNQHCGTKVLLVPRRRYCVIISFNSQFIETSSHFH